MRVFSVLPAEAPDAPLPHVRAVRRLGRVAPSVLTVYLLFSFAADTESVGDALRPCGYPALHLYFTSGFSNLPLWVCRYFWIPHKVWEVQLPGTREATEASPMGCDGPSPVE